MPAMSSPSGWDQCPGENLRRRTIAQHLPGPVIDPVLHCPDLGFRHHAEVRAFREVLADQAVGVFVQTPLPGMVGSGEMEIRRQRTGNRLVPRKLLAVVRREGMDPIPERPHALGQRFGHRGRRLHVDPLQNLVLRPPIHRRDQGAPVPRADDRIQLPVPDAGLLLHHRRAVGNVHPAGNVAPSGMPATAPVRLLPPATQVPVQGASRPTVRPNMPVDPFTARHDLALKPIPARNLFRAPSLPQPVFHHLPELGRHLAGNSGDLPAPGRRLAMRLLVTVASLPAVARHLPGYRTGVPSEPAGYLPLRQATMQQAVDLASFAMGQVMVACWHDSSPLLEQRLFAIIWPAATRPSKKHSYVSASVALHTGTGAIFFESGRVETACEHDESPYLKPRLCVIIRLAVSR